MAKQKKAFVNPFNNPGIGRRTGLNVLEGKNIRKLSNGMDNFDDYWSDSCASEDSMAAMMESTPGPNPDVNKNSTLRSMTPFSSNSANTSTLKRATRRGRTAEPQPRKSPSSVTIDTTEVLEPRRTRQGVLAKSAVSLNQAGDEAGTISRNTTAHSRIEPGSPPQNFRTKKRLTYSRGSDRNSSTLNSSQSIDEPNVKFAKPTTLAPKSTVGRRRSQVTPSKVSNKSSPENGNPTASEIRQKNSPTRTSKRIQSRAEINAGQTFPDPIGAMSDCTPDKDSSTAVQPKEDEIPLPNKNQSFTVRSATHTDIADVAEGNDDGICATEDGHDETSRNRVDDDNYEPENGENDDKEEENEQHEEADHESREHDHEGKEQDENQEDDTETIQKDIRVPTNVEATEQEVVDDHSRRNVTGVDGKPNIDIELVENVAPETDRSIHNAGYNPQSESTGDDSVNDDFDVITYHTVSRKRQSSTILLPVKSSQNNKSSPHKQAQSGKKRKEALLRKQSTNSRPFFVLTSDSEDDDPLESQQMHSSPGKYRTKKISKKQKSDTEKKGLKSKPNGKQSKHGNSNIQSSSGTVLKNKKQASKNDKLVAKAKVNASFVSSQSKGKAKGKSSTSESSDTANLPERLSESDSQRKSSPSPKIKARAHNTSRTKTMEEGQRDSCNDTEPSTSDHPFPTSPNSPGKRAGKDTMTKSSPQSRHGALSAKKTKSKGRKSSKAENSSSEPEMTIPVTSQKKKVQSGKGIKKSVKGKAPKKNHSIPTRKIPTSSESSVGGSSRTDRSNEEIDPASKQSPSKTPKSSETLSVVKTTRRKKSIEGNIETSSILKTSKDKRKVTMSATDDDNAQTFGDTATEGDLGECADGIDANTTPVKSPVSTEKNTSKKSPRSGKRSSSETSNDPDRRKSTRPRCSPVAWYNNEIPVYSSPEVASAVIPSQTPGGASDSDVGDELSPPIVKKAKQRKAQPIIETPGTIEMGVTRAAPRKSILRLEGTPRRSMASTHFAEVLPKYTGRKSDLKLPRYSTASPLHFNDVTCSQRPGTPYAAKRKASQKIIPPGSVKEGLRRSRRTRVRPLDWVRHERIIYRYDESGLREVAEVCSPEEEVPPKGKKLKQLVKKKRNQRKAPKTPRRLSMHRHFDGNVNALKTTVLTCASPNREHLVDMDCVRSGDAMTFRGPHGHLPDDEDPYIMCKALLHRGFSTGKLLIRPSCSKERQIVQKDSMIFYIIHGKLGVEIHETTTILTSGDFFFVPQGNTYSIKNLRNEEAKLIYYQHKHY